jgi:hypothetical protein
VQIAVSSLSSARIWERTESLVYIMKQSSALIQKCRHEVCVWAVFIRPLFINIVSSESPWFHSYLGRNKSRDPVRWPRFAGRVSHHATTELKRKNYRNNRTSLLNPVPIMHATLLQQHDCTDRSENVGYTWKFN